MPMRTSAAGKRLIVLDGDSFVIGGERFRLKGIDAPELHQVCRDAQGKTWGCGKVARQVLVKMLSEPRLTCESVATDQYNRLLATCNTIRSPDIAADQVRGGMAISDDFYGIRTYGDEQDNARQAKRGIWQGAFVSPAGWRALNTSQKTVAPGVFH
ncbi:MAG: thermonuclease family protein [Sphingomonadaceae bacterium]|nr:thermonuclease family protein [Sphingomonadaceae bacterium]